MIDLSGLMSNRLAARMRTGLPRRRRLAAALLLVLGASAAAAQQLWVGGEFGSFPPRLARASDFDGSFLFCRMAFTSGRRLPSGRGWSTDYPGADINFSIRLAELTRVDVKFGPDRQPDHVVIPLTDPLLFRCPLLFMTHYGEVRFSTEEAIRLREYLLKGGFLWADDAWGTVAWTSWTSEFAKVLPPGEFPMTDLSLTHGMLRTLYEVKELPQIPSINFWYRSRGATSELGRDSQQVSMKGIYDDRGHLMVLVTHNTDISDAWEREGENSEYFDLFSPRGYAVGVDVALYAMTH
jgi:hypothetical protein